MFAAQDGKSCCNRLISMDKNGNDIRMGSREEARLKSLLDSWETEMKSMSRPA